MCAGHSSKYKTRSLIESFTALNRYSYIHKDMQRLYFHYKPYFHYKSYLFMSEKTVVAASNGSPFNHHPHE